MDLETFDIVDDEQVETKPAEKAPAEKAADKKDEKKGDEKKPPKDDETAAQLRELRESQKTLNSRLSESEQNARYWYEQAKNGKKAPAAEPPDELADAKGEDFVEAFSSNEPKRIMAALDKLGYAKKSEVSKTIAKSRAQISDEARFVSQYPGMLDNNSEFFKTATKHYNELLAEGEDRDDPRTLKTAARLAKTELDAKPAVESEEDRNKRVRSQQGDKGNRRPPENTEENDELSPQQRKIVQNMIAGGARITEDDYKKFARQGVKMAGTRVRSSAA